MNSVHYAIGFTLALCVSLFYGVNDTSTYTQQAALIFGGFMLGGIVILLIEDL
jgi:hypothetical protein